MQCKHLYWLNKKKADYKGMKENEVKERKKTCAQQSQESTLTSKGENEQMVMQRRD